MTTTIPSGISAQLMTGEQSAYNTAVTPDRGVEFRSESLTMDAARIQSSALRAGALVQRSDRWKPGSRRVGGDVTLELGTKGYGRWFEHALGNVVTSQPDAVGSPTVYKHTFTPANLPAGGLTVQAGRPDKNGTVHPFTFWGCMVRQWTLDQAVNELALLTASLIGRDATTATPLAAISYPTGSEPLSFIQGSLSIGGASTPVRTFQMQGSNVLADERFDLGSAVRERPEVIGMSDLGGTFEKELAGLDLYAAFVAGDEAELEFLWRGDLIEDTFFHETRVTANIRYDGGTPTVTGPQMVMQSIPYKIVDNGTLSLKIEYQTTDTTP